MEGPDWLGPTIIRLAIPWTDGVGGRRMHVMVDRPLGQSQRSRLCWQNTSMVVLAPTISQPLHVHRARYFTGTTRLPSWLQKNVQQSGIISNLACIQEAQDRILTSFVKDDLHALAESVLPLLQVMLMKEVCRFRAKAKQLG